MKKGILLAIALLVLSLCGCKAAVETEEIWLLEKHLCYDANGALIYEANYRYNDNGAVLFYESMHYDSGEVTMEERLEFSEEDIDEGVTYCYEMAAIGRFYTQIVTEPLFRDEVGEDCIVNSGEPGYECTDTDLEFLYAEYTFDEWDCPIHITTYGLDGEILGTCEMTWTSREVVKVE